MPLLGFPNNSSSIPVAKQTTSLGHMYWLAFPYAWTLFINQFTDYLYHLILAAINSSSCQPAIVSVSTLSCGISVAWHHYWLRSSLLQCFCIILFLPDGASEMLGDRTTHISASTEKLCLWLKKNLLQILPYIQNNFLYILLNIPPCFFVLYTTLSIDPFVITQQHISPMQPFPLDKTKEKYQLLASYLTCLRLMDSPIYIRKSGRWNMETCSKELTRFSSPVHFMRHIRNFVKETLIFLVQDSIKSQP